MHAHSRKIVGQEWLIKLMQALGYENIQSSGRCFGIAAMAMQAFLAGEEDVFNERIKRLYRLSQLSVTRIKTLQTKPMNEQIDGYDLKIVDVRAFLDGIALYQDPVSYREIFSEVLFPTQRNMFALPVVLPVKLDSDPPQRCQTSCGVYDLSQLITYLTQLQEHLTVRTSLMLNSSNHAISLSFDPQKNRWILFDANDLPAKAFGIHQTNDLAEEIMDDFNAGNHNKNDVIFSANFFVCKKNNIEQFKKDYSKLQSQENWKMIHHITPQTTTKRDAFDSDLLIAAVKCGDRETVQSLLDAGANPEHAQITGWTALYFAIQHREAAIVTMLLEKGANPKYINKEGWTPLHFAARYGYREIVKIILRAKVNPNDCVGTNNLTPLHLAVQNRHCNVVEVLLQADDANPNCMNQWNLTPLHLAAQKGYDDIAKVLLDHPQTNINCADQEGWTPLHFAVKNGNFKIVEMLLNHPQVNVNFIDIAGLTPLHLAAQEGQAHIISLLLKHPKIQRNCRDKDNRTPLHIAIENERLDAAYALLKHDDFKNIFLDKRGLTPLHLAAQKGYLTIVKMLLNFYKSNINCVNKAGRTPLYMAIAGNCMAVIEFFLNYPKININHVDHEGWTPLHFAINAKRVRIIIALLEKGANQAVKDKKGNTPINLLLADDSQLNMIITISKMLKEKMLKDKDSEIDSTSPFGRLVQCSAFFEKLKHISEEIETVDEKYQTIVQDLYKTFYQLGKAWIEQDTKNVLLFQTKINDVLSTHDIHLKEGSLGFFKQPSFFSVFNEANEALKAVMHDEKKPILDK